MLGRTTIATGWFGIPGGQTSRSTKVHVVDKNGPICGSRLSEKQQFQFCSRGARIEWIECRNCLQIAKRMNMKDCEHIYVKDGMRYLVGKYKNPEYARLADANPVFYYTFYFCEKCLNKQYEKMGLELDTYAAVRYDALPMPESDRLELLKELESG
jgi:hypothetical protein